MPSLLAIFQALADQTRLRILALLRDMELSVGELAQVLGQSQPGVSRHVKILVQAGLVTRRKEGNWVFLALANPEKTAPLYAMIEQWPADPELAADAHRLGSVRAARTAEAEEYFEAHAAQWDAIRSLHVAEQDVENAIRRLIGPQTVTHLVDIGTGTGRMLELLAPQAETMAGFDRSPAMLRVARAKLTSAGLERATLRQGDLYALPLPAGTADLAIMHQVLHAVQHPATAIAEAARILCPGGRLLIVDFAPHARETLRDAHAHVHPGFSDTQIRGWFHDAGLACAQTVRLEGPLTVRLWMGRRP
ncbi:MAG: metalloregulator ArsR/SmtB family transcription factor [Acetobacter peroxydans]|jgi:ArsR family transcriptional regulator|nr:metalloregulator ArsR/SmtB family transcription factor [Acetobacter peroxydans]